MRSCSALSHAWRLTSLLQGLKTFATAIFVLLIDQEYSQLFRSRELLVRPNLIV